MTTNLSDASNTATHVSANRKDNKIFIVGLPRTGTTSVCIALLNMGFRTAHTAFKAKVFEQAQAIADTPIFNDYQALDTRYPNAKFVLLERELHLWLPSIQQLLQRMHKNIACEHGGFHPTMKRCYLNTFAPFTLSNISSEVFLEHCYTQHNSAVKQHFSNRSQKLLNIDISEPDAYNKLFDFVRHANNAIAGQAAQATFEHVNKGGKITYWKKVKHPLKVASV